MNLLSICQECLLDSQTAERPNSRLLIANSTH